MLIAADPIICSGCIFLLQSLIIFTTSKYEFAVFSLSYSYIVMGQAILAGVFGGPIITLVSRQDDETTKLRLGNALLRANLAAALSTGFFAFFIGFVFKLNLVLFATSLFAFILLAFRDAVRGVLICRNEAKRSFCLAVGFATVSLTYVGVRYWWTGQVDTLDCLTAIGIGTGSTMLSAMTTAISTKASLGQHERRELAGMAIWSLPGSIVIWMQNSFYLTIIAKNIGMQAVGEVSTARLIVMPILVASGALLRIAQAHSAKLLQDNGPTKASHAARRLAVPIALAGIGAASAIFVAADWLPKEWLPHEHPNIGPLVACWMAFTAAAIARGLYTSLYQAMGRYRELFAINMISLPFVLAGIALAPLWIGICGAIIPLALGEVFMMVVMSNLAVRNDVRSR